MAIKKQTKELLEDLRRSKEMAEDSKFYQYKEDINGTEYVWQYCGKRRAIQITDECTDDNNKVSKEKLLDKMLTALIVSPSVNLDFFDTEEHMDDYDRVLEVTNIIFGGKFRHNQKLKLPE